MKPALMLTLAAPLLTAACLGSSGAGGLRIEQLPENVVEDCKHPSEFLGPSDWEIIAGRIGDELIACREEKKIAVAGFDGVRGAVE